MDPFFGSSFGDQAYPGAQQDRNQHDSVDDMTFGDLHHSPMFTNQQLQQPQSSRRSQSISQPTRSSHDGRRQSLQPDPTHGMAEFGSIVQPGSLEGYQFAPNTMDQNIMMMPVGAMMPQDAMTANKHPNGGNNGGQMNMMSQYLNSNPQQYSGLNSPASNMSGNQSSSQPFNMAMMSQILPQQQMGKQQSQQQSQSQQHQQMQQHQQQQMQQQQQQMINNGMAFMVSQSGMPMMSHGQFIPNVMMAPVNQSLQQTMQQNSDPSSAVSGSPVGDNNMSQDLSSAANQLAHQQMLNASTTHSRSGSRHASLSGPSQLGSTQVDSNNNSSTPPVRQDTTTTAMPRGYQGPWNTGLSHHPTSIALRPNSQTSFVNAYSSTGFDMLQVLMRVATRKNPEINIGAVDLSCAFVVCDALEHDFPIVYCSENFERLTGYTKHEILGRNCRFLQAPDGKVQAGIPRHYADDNTVLYLKNAITARQEAQVSLINYRKGGQPFMNLLTMIPVAFESEGVRFFVGFQVDLVEQPNSVTSKNPDGTYVVNYQRGLTMPRYVYSSPESKPPETEAGQTISKDDVSQVLATLGTAESDLTKRVWDKVLLENTDDVIYVLSLKGLFLYLSPSSKNILEYDPSELVGTALSSVCHPSDIVPVTRELKDTMSGVPISVVYRIRRKHSGYMWFEGYGTLHTEQGKGRKSIVLVGRERPVYAISKTEIQASGGIAENEVWTKLSTSGMFLFVSSNIRSMLDKQPDELVGTSIQTLMRPESRSDFLRILEIARTGKRASAKHELVNRRGQVLQAFSTVYPGDASEGSKPTFFIAQTRLLKFSRPPAGSSKPTIPKLERESSSRSLADSASPMGSMGIQSSRRNSNSVSLPSPSKYMSTFEAVTTYGGQDGLPLGHQDVALASEQNLFDELKTTRSTSWQFELRQMEKRNRLLAEELQGLLAARKKRKRRKPAGSFEKECANCHTRQTPEWRRGPSGNRDLCNSCGLRWAKQQGRISPRTSSAKSAVSGSGSPPGGANTGATSAGQRRTSQGKEGSGGETRSIGETLAEAAQKSESAAPSATNNAGQHVSKAQKTESGSPPQSVRAALPTKVEID